MGKTILSFAVAGLLSAFGLIAEAQQSTKIPRIGYLRGTPAPTNTTPDLNADVFRQGLRDLGYVEGKNILLEYHHGEGNTERQIKLLHELVQLKVDVLVLATRQSILEAKQLNKAIPIVIVTNLDPVAAGLVESLSHPGGNITGLTTLMRDLGGKRLELLIEVVPRISRVGILRVNTQSAAFSFKEYEA